MDTTSVGDEVGDAKGVHASAGSVTDASSPAAPGTASAAPARLVCDDDIGADTGGRATDPRDVPSREFYSVGATDGAATYGVSPNPNTLVAGAACDEAHVSPGAVASAPAMTPTQGDTDLSDTMLQAMTPTQGDTDLSDTMLQAEAPPGAQSDHGSQGGDASAEVAGGGDCKAAPIAIPTGANSADHDSTAPPATSVAVAAPHLADSAPDLGEGVDGAAGERSATTCDRDLVPVLCVPQPIPCSKCACTRLPGLTLAT